MNINLITKPLIKRLGATALMIACFLMVQSRAKAEALRLHWGLIIGLSLRKSNINIAWYCSSSLGLITCIYYAVIRMTNGAVKNRHSFFIFLFFFKTSTHQGWATIITALQCFSIQANTLWLFSGSSDASDSSRIIKSGFCNTARATYIRLFSP
jgi:hypothetical protein